jgi:uncharacterized membrane protein YbhN (UPF0104 family)
VVGLAIIGFAARRISQQWTAISAAPIHFELHPWPLVGAFMIIWLAYGMLVLAWRLMVLALGSPMTLGGAARTWTVSSLGKYLPGKVWAIAGLAVLAKEAGASPVIATASALLQQLVGLATGVLVVLVFGQSTLQRSLPGGIVAVWVLAGGTLMALGVALHSRIRVRLLRLVSAEAAEAGAHAVPWSTIVVSISANLAAWAAYGVALWLLAHALFPDAARFIGPRPVIAAFTAAYVAGILAFVSPGGLGVREGVLAAALGPSLGAPTAVALALAARLLFTMTELGAAAPFVLLSKEKLRAFV